GGGGPGRGPGMGRGARSPGGTAGAAAMAAARISPRRRPPRVTERLGGSRKNTRCVRFRIENLRYLTKSKPARTITRSDPGGNGLARTFRLGGISWGQLRNQAGRPGDRWAARRRWHDGGQP